VLLKREQGESFFVFFASRIRFCVSVFLCISSGFSAMKLKKSETQNAGEALDGKRLTAAVVSRFPKTH